MESAQAVQTVKRMACPHRPRTPRAQRSPGKWRHSPGHAPLSPSCRNVVPAQGSATPRVKLTVRIAFPLPGGKLSNKDRPRAPLSLLLLLRPAGVATRGSGKMAFDFPPPRGGGASLSENTANGGCGGQGQPKARHLEAVAVITASLACNFYALSASLRETPDTKNLTLPAAGSKVDVPVATTLTGQRLSLCCTYCTVLAHCLLILFPNEFYNVHFFLFLH